MHLGDSVLGMELEVDRDDMVWMLAKHLGWEGGFSDWNLTQVILFDDDDRVVLRLRKREDTPDEGTSSI